MPRVTIFIRNSDHRKWLAIPDKPIWLHERIQEKKNVVIVTSNKNIKKGQPVVAKDVKGKPDGKTRLASKGAGKESLCPQHGIPLDNRGRCLQKGCKYA